MWPDALVRPARSRAIRDPDSASGRVAVGLHWRRLPVRQHHIGAARARPAATAAEAGAASAQGNGNKKNRNTGGSTHRHGLDLTMGSLPLQDASSSVRRTSNLERHRPVGTGGVQPMATADTMIHHVPVHVPGQTLRKGRGAAAAGGACRLRQPFVPARAHGLLRNQELPSGRAVLERIEPQPHATTHTANQPIGRARSFERLSICSLSLH